MDPLIGQMAYQSLAPQMQDLIWQCNLNAKDAQKLFKSCKNDFWKDVLFVWAEKHYDDQISLDQIIWLNSKLVINGKPTWNRRAYQAGLCRISQLFQNGKKYHMKKQKVASDYL